jgi:hypothetical protein
METEILAWEGWRTMGGEGADGGLGRKETVMDRWMDGEEEGRGRRG